MKVYRRYYLIPFLYGIIFSWYGSFHNSKKIELWQMVSAITGGNIINSMSNQVISVIFEHYVPFFMFIIIFSTYIYRNFCNSSVYVFSRCENRVKWYMKEILKLLLFTWANAMMILAGYIITAVVGNKLAFRTDSIFLVVRYLIIYTLWSFSIVLLANIISILKNGILGNIVAISIPIIVTVCLMTVNFEKLKGMEWKKLIWNPCAYLVFGWYNVKIENKQIIGSMSRGLSIQRGYLMFAAISLIVVIVGAAVVQQIDIMDNKE